MRSFSEIRESPNYLRLKDSVEFKAERRSLIVVSVFSLIIFLLAAADQRSSTSRVLAIILFGGLLLYQVYRLIRIFFHIDSYTFTETVLDQPQRGYRNTMYFTVRLRDRYGKEFEADTNTIFTHSEPVFEDYVNQRVLIGYNGRTGLVVVIKKLP